MIVGTNICFVVVPCSNNHCWKNCFNNDCWNKLLFHGCSVLARFVIGYCGGGTKKVFRVGTHHSVRLTISFPGQTIKEQQSLFSHLGR